MEQRRDLIQMQLQGGIFQFEGTLLDGAGRPLPGVEQFLSLMKMEGVWMYLVAEGGRRQVQQALEETGLAPYFRGVMTAEEHRHTLTDPELYEKAVRRLRTARRATVIFTSRSDVLRAGKEAGFQVVLVQPDADRELRELADEVIADYREMSAIKSSQ